MEAARGGGTTRVDTRVALVLALILPLLMLVLASYVALPGLGAQRIASVPERAGAEGARALGQGTFSPLTSAFVNRVIGNAGQLPGDGSAGPVGPDGAITVVGATAAEQPVAVNLPAKSNDDFDKAFGIDTLPFTGRTDTRSATRQAGEPSSCSAVLGTVWFKYSPTTSGPLTVSTFGSSYGAITGIFTGSWGNLSQVGCVATTIADFNATAGSTYYFQVAGKGGDLVFHLVTAAGLPSVDRVSVADDGHQEIYGGNIGAISADGRYVAYNTGDETMTGASELSNVLADLGFVPANCTHEGDIKPDFNPAEPTHTGIRPDCNVVYVHDRVTGRNTTIDYGYQEVLSDDGRYVAYTGSGARESDPQVFVKDRVTGRRWLVNHALGLRTVEANGWSTHPVISGDGRYVAFTSIASDSVANDANGRAPDAFLWDRSTGRIRLITSDSRGLQQDGSFPGINWESGFMDCLSRDGRWAVFATQAINFDVFNAHGIWELYRKDLRTGRLDRVSVPLGGGLPTGDSQPPGVNGGHCISSNGRLIAFPSYATNLVPHDTNGTVDFFVRDMRRHVTQRVDVSSTGSQAIGDSHGCLTSGVNTPFGRGRCSGESTNFECAITPDGRYVGFNSGATNLVANDANNVWDVFRHDLLTGETIRLSVPDPDAPTSKAGSAGEQGFGGDSVGGDMSADGRVAVFVSGANNFVAADTNNVGDVFVAVLPRRPS